MCEDRSSSALMNVILFAVKQNIPRFFFQFLFSSALHMSLCETNLIHESDVSVVVKSSFKFIKKLLFLMHRHEMYDLWRMNTVESWFLIFSKIRLKLNRNTFQIRWLKRISIQDLIYKFQMIHWEVKVNKEMLSSWLMKKKIMRLYLVTTIMPKTATLTFITLVTFSDSHAIGQG